MPVHVVDCTVLQERNPEFTEPQSFIMGIKFAPGELGADVIFIMLGSKRNFPLLLRDTLALSSKAVHYADSPEKIVHNKGSQCPACKMGRNARDPC